MMSWQLKPNNQFGNRLVGDSIAWGKPAPANSLVDLIPLPPPVVVALNNFTVKPKGLSLSL